MLSFSFGDGLTLTMKQTHVKHRVWIKIRDEQLQQDVFADHCVRETFDLTMDFMDTCLTKKYNQARGRFKHAAIVGVIRYAMMAWGC